MERDPRRAFARLAVAVMIADGRITASEEEALERLDELGIGPLSTFMGEEIRRGVVQPIDLRSTCASLLPLGPEAAAIVLAALAGLAASDGAVEPAEIATLNTVADHLGLPEADGDRIIQSAIALCEGHEAVLDGSEPRVRVVPVQEVSPQGSAATAAAALQAEAYRVLGVEAGASRESINLAYLRLVERYTPTKVGALGTEFALLAVRKLAEATAAFEIVVGSLPSAT